MAIKAYCVKCKAKDVDMQNAQIVQTARGGFMAKGTCAKDGKTVMCAMMSKDNAEKAIKNGDAKKAY